MNITLLIILLILFEFLAFFFDLTELEYVLLLSFRILFICCFLRQFTIDLLLSLFNDSIDDFPNCTKPHQEEATAEVAPGLYNQTHR